MMTLMNMLSFSILRLPFKMMMLQVTSNYDDTYECDSICIIIEVDFNDIAQKAPHVEIKIFYLVKIIIILVVVAYIKYCNCKIMVQKGDINERWLRFYDSVIVSFIIVKNKDGAITLTYLQ